MRLRVVIGVAAGLCLASLSLAQHRFDSPTAGFALTKPANWVFASVQAAQANRDSVRLSDAELEARMKTQANPPLVMITRHPEPYPDLNPSVQVGLRPLGQLEGKSASDLLTMMLPTLEKAYADFKIVTPVQPSTLGGHPAARLGISYTLKTTGGDSFPTRSDLVVVPRGRFMFFIGMGRKPGDSEADADIDAILKSVEIAN